MSRISARAVIEYDGKYLLVRNNYNHGAFWCLPGGGVEPGEDIVSALQRELVEETGVTPEVGNLLFVHQIKYDDGYAAPGFYFHIKNGEDYLKLDIAGTTHGTLELAEIAFVNIESIHVLPTFLKVELPILAGLKFEVPTQIRRSPSEE